MPKQQMNTKDVELSLIDNDIVELQLIIMAMANHRFSGYLGLLLFPIISFVVEESHKYLVSRNIENVSSTLFDSYEISIKKARALLKLFNDTDGGKSGLLEELHLYQEKSLLWMNAGKSGCTGFVSKLVQPDMGVYFLDEDPIYMTIVGFSITGRVKNEIESLTEEDFEDISQQTKSFSIAIGEYFAAIEILMSQNGISRNHIIPVTIPSDINITHNDFHSKDLYKKIANLARLKDANLAPGLFFILTQVNTAYTVLPRLLPPDSNLLVRIQFLTAYHAIKSLLEIENTLDYELSNLLQEENILKKIPNVKRVRNVLAHYGLGKGRQDIIGDFDALNDVIRDLSGLSKVELAELSKNQLGKISMWTRNKFSKTRLRKARALFGDHT
jgi:hypothetical protein